MDPNADPRAPARPGPARRLLALVAALGIGGGVLAYAASGGGEGSPQTVAARTTGDAPLVFGVVPQQSATRLAAMWGPLVKRLSAELGRPVRFATTKDIPTFESCLASGSFDIAYMNPYHYVVFSQRSGYRAAVNQSGKKLRGLLVVRGDSAAETLASLKGSVIAFPSPGAFGASVLPRAEMTRLGIPFEPRYARSHDSVYRAVEAGLVAAGGGVRRTFDAAPQELRDALKVIYTTDAYTPHAIAVKGDAALMETVRAALLDAAEQSPELVGNLGMSGFQSAGDADYDDVRALNIDPQQAGLDQIDEVACPFD